MLTQKDLVDYLTDARNVGASDVHISVGAPPAARVDGQLRPLEDFDFDADTCKQLIMAALSENQRARLEEDLELDFALQVEEVGRFRGNAHYARGNVEAAFRFIPTEIPDLRALGHNQVVEDLCKLRQGLILVTGVTGSGKSTTIASMIQRIANERSCVIVTIEDPIEFAYESSYGIVKQRQVGEDTHGFANALRSALRQDPDVIVVSELRDLETIRTAITAAETGHLVISTLHTIDAPKSLDRLIDVFPPDQQSQIITQLGNCLEAIVSQRLIVRADQPGRVLATEILKMNHAVRACISDKKFNQLPGLLQINAKDGMHTIDDSLIYLMESGYISYGEAWANAREKSYIESRLEK
jgi:twitching motility protein PilT